MTAENAGRVREPDAPLTATPLAWLLAESVSDVIAILDPQARIAYANHASTRLLGYDIDALIGRDARSLVHPDDIPRVEEALARVLTGPEAPVVVRCRIRHAAGHHLVMETRGTLDRTLPAGPAIVIVSRDVTLQHRRECLQRCWIEALKQEHPAPDVVLLHCCAALVETFELELVFALRPGGKGRMTVVAQAGSEAALKPWLDSGLHWSGPRALSCLARAVRTGRPTRVGAEELRSLCVQEAGDSADRVAPYLLPLKSIDGEGGVLVLVSTDRGRLDDATALLDDFSIQLGLLLDRIAQEAQLSLLGGALEAAANAIFITDRDAVIEWVNDAFVALSGYAREELMGRTPRILHSGVQGHEYYRGLKQAVRAGKSWCGEITNRRKDGSLYTAHQTITPIPDGGERVTHFIAIQQDITEHKRMERQIRELASGVELARQSERGQIAREVHDELGGSLVSLRHDIEWLTKRVSDPVVLERLRVMHELAVHSLDAARTIVAGLRPTVVDEVGLVDAISWLAREFSQRHGFEVVLNLDPELGCVAPQQAAEIYRVVQECLTNVAKHACASRVRICGRINERLLVFEVIDDGVGTSVGHGASGTRGMSERALLMGGYLEIGPASGGGTEVRLVVPLSSVEGCT